MGIFLHIVLFQKGEIMNIKHILATLAIGAILAGCFHTEEPVATTSTETTTTTVPETRTETKVEAPEVESTETKIVEEAPTIQDVVQLFDSTVDSKVYFEYNKFDLSDEAKSILNSQVAFISGYEGLIVVVEGHADERGTREYNFALAQKRANAVREYMELRDNGKNQYKVISYGKERPAVLGSTEAAWAKNRRAATVVQ